MTNLISKNKLRVTFCLVLVIAFLCIIFSGCSIADFAIEKLSEIKSKDKIQCTVDEDNGTKIVYDEITYQILDETIDKSEIGGWRGVFRNIAIIDENYSVLKQIKMKADPTTQIKDIVKNPPENVKYVVPFYNAFAIKDTDDDEAIVVHIFSGFYKAVPVDLKSKDAKIIKYDKETLTEIVMDLTHKG